MFIENICETTTNLKDGKGCPWAGHIKLNVADFSAVNAFILSLEENFGNALPTGSKNTKCAKWQIRTKETSVYLNAGTG